MFKVIADYNKNLVSSKQVQIFPPLLNNNEYMLMELSLDRGLNKAGSMNLKVPYNFFVNDDLQDGTIWAVRVFQDNEEIWYGRVNSYTIDKDGNVSYTFEGALTFLKDIYTTRAQLYGTRNDPVMVGNNGTFHLPPLYVYGRYTLAQGFENILNRYSTRRPINASIIGDEDDTSLYISYGYEIYPGNFNIINYNPSLRWDMVTPERTTSEYWEAVSVYDEIMRNTIDRFGGYLTFRRDSKTDNLYLDYDEILPEQKTSQVIEYGSNLLDISITNKVYNMVNRIIPLGYFGQISTSLSSGPLILFRGEYTYLCLYMLYELYRSDFTSKRAELQNKGYDMYSYTFNHDAMISYIGNVDKRKRYGDRIMQVISPSIRDDWTGTMSLIDNALQKFIENERECIELSVKAFDRNLIDPTVEKIKLGQYAKVVSPIHKVNGYYLCSNIYNDLLVPTNSVYSFGEQMPSSLTSTLAANAKEGLIEAAREIAPIILKTPDEELPGDVKTLKMAAKIINETDISKSIWEKEDS